MPALATSIRPSQTPAPDAPEAVASPEVRRAEELSGLDFRSLYEAYKSKVYGTVHHVVGVSDEIDDIVQSVFLEIHRSLPRYKGQSKLSTWIYRIAVNVALQHIRRRRRRRVFLFFKEPEEDRDTEQSEDDTPRHEQRDLLRKLHKLLEGISEKKRVVFVLHELDGRDVEEVGELLEIPVNTVRSRLHAARVELTEKMKRAGMLEEGS